MVAQPAVTLKRSYGCLGCLTVEAALGADGAEPGSAKPALQVADGLAALTDGQREVTRNSSSSWSSWDLPLAPTRRLCTSPPEKTNRVGMLITL